MAKTTSIEIFSNIRSLIIIKCHRCKFFKKTFHQNYRVGFFHRGDNWRRNNSKSTALGNSTTTHLPQGDIKCRPALKLVGISVFTSNHPHNGLSDYQSSWLKLDRKLVRTKPGESSLERFVDSLLRPDGELLARPAVADNDGVWRWCSDITRSSQTILSLYPQTTVEFFSFLPTDKSASHHYTAEITVSFFTFQSQDLLLESLKSNNFNDGISVNL